MSQALLFLKKQRLLAKILDSDLNEILINNPQLNSKQQRLFDKQIKLLESGYPLDYLLGRIRFGDLQIILNNKVLIPREETEWWVNILKVRFQSNPELYKDQFLVDIGCGSGIIGLSLCSNFQQLWVSDISRSNLILTLRNSELNSLPRPKLILSDLLSSRTFKQLSHSRWVLVSNLPYLPEVDKSSAVEFKINYEPSEALYSGIDGLDLFRKLCQQLSTNLNNNLPSEIYLELDPRNIRTARSILDELYPVTEIWTDLNGHERVLCGRFD